MLTYCYSIGEGSAREMSRLTEYHPALRWLTGLKRINYHTISSFRIGHKVALDDLMIQLLGVLMEKKLVTLERITQDGTKIKAYSSADGFRREERLNKCLEEAREQVRIVDAAGEDGTVSKRSAKAKRRAARERLELLEEAQKQLKQLQSEKTKQEEKEKTRVSMTDPDARNMKQADGGFAPSYNLQLGTDAGHKS